MNRLIVPPLPAASRPSKTMTCLAGVHGPVLELQQLDLQQVLLHLVVVAGHQLVVGVVLAPRLDRACRRADQHGVVAVVVAHRVSLGSQVVDVVTQAHLLHGPTLPHARTRPSGVQSPLSRRRAAAG